MGCGRYPGDTASVALVVVIALFLLWMIWGDDGGSHTGTGGATGATTNTEEFGAGGNAANATLWGGDSPKSPSGRPRVAMTSEDDAWLAMFPSAMPDAYETTRSGGGWLYPELHTDTR
jgi:hypothetical protein